MVDAFLGGVAGSLLFSLQNNYMSTEKIKIKKDTPWHGAGEIIGREEFDKYYVGLKPESQTLWFEVLESELQFGDKEVGISITSIGTTDVYITCKGETYLYTELKQWRVHLDRVFVTGFFTGKQFTTFYTPFGDVPQAIVNKTDYETFQRLRIGFGCLTGTLKQLDLILGSCERLLAKNGCKPQLVHQSINIVNNKPLS